MIVGHSISNVVEKIEKNDLPKTYSSIFTFVGLCFFFNPMFLGEAGHSFLAESGYPSLRPRRTGDLAINAWCSMPHGESRPSSFCR